MNSLFDICVLDNNKMLSSGLIRLLGWLCEEVKINTVEKKSPLKLLPIFELAWYHSILAPAQQSVLHTCLCSTHTHTHTHQHIGTYGYTQQEQSFRNSLLSTEGSVHFSTRFAFL